MKVLTSSTLFPATLSCAALLLAFTFFYQKPVGAAGPVEPLHSSYRVLAPIESGNLILFPVVQTAKMEQSPFITLDEGIKSGDVEITEAGRARGLVRPRPAAGPPDSVLHPHPNSPPYRADQVNTLVLINHSEKPLLLLAGEIVTGGKQDRIVAKDRIVPVGNEPIDLGVFCIEPGRWTEATTTFGASAKSSTQSIMVQPMVREQAMVAKDQQEVWNSVHGAIGGALKASAPSSSTSSLNTPETDSLGTTSYARAMQNGAVVAKVDEAAAPLTRSREQILQRLREEHAVGVVVAVRGQIVWADIFSNTDLLGRYWTKLVRSYAAESLLDAETHSSPSIADAQHFLDTPEGGTETSIGDVGVYRYRELRFAGTEAFVLECLLPGTGYDVHISKVRMRGDARRIKTPMPY